MTDRAPDIKEILDSYDRSQEALNFTPRSDNDIRAQMIATAVREWNGDLVAALESLVVKLDECKPRIASPQRYISGAFAVQNSGPTYAAELEDARAALKDTK